MNHVDEMYERYAKPVYKYIYTLCHSAQDAEEMTAETFTRAVAAIHTFSGECKLLTWLCQIAKHVWYKELERRSRMGAAELSENVVDPSCSPGDAVTEQEDKLALYRCIRLLDPTTREVVYLRLSGELSFREIGEIMNKTENWARVTFYRGKERMRRNETQ